MKRLVVTMTAIAVTALPGLASAQAKAPAATPAPAPSICALATLRIESIQKELAQLHVDGIGEDSAPRATMRAAETTAMFAEAQVLLTQMGQAKCTPYPDTIGWLRYLGEASACASAKLNFKSGDTLNECRMSVWKTEAPAEVKSVPKVDLSGIK